MKVTLLRSIGTRDFSKYDLDKEQKYEEGATVEVSNKTGDALVKVGLAVAGTVNIRAVPPSQPTLRAVPPKTDNKDGLPK